ncbi:MAG: type II secretion system F family protein [Pseudomonadota bacterium]
MNMVLVFGSLILVVVLVTAFLFIHQQKQRKKHLLKTVQGKSSFVDNKKGKVSAQDQRRSDLAKKLKEDESQKEGKKKSLSDSLAQSGMNMSVAQFWIFSVVSAVVFYFLAQMMGLSVFVKVMFVIIGFFGFPRWFVKFKTKRRQKAFMKDFPDALESMMRMLKAGMPVGEAIRMVATEFEGPMGEEMERIYEQQKIGVPLPEAVLNAAKRMPLAEMQMFATAIAIQTQTGSSLSEVLQNLAGVIRARFKLRRKVVALSSEAKASAAIIASLPCLVTLALYFLNGEYLEVLYTTSTGKTLAYGAVIWMGIGVLIMRQMINFKV